MGVAAMIVVLPATAWGQEKLTPDKVPAKVMAAAKERFPGAEFTSITKEKENNQVIYDLELKHQGRKYEMDIKEDGTIIEIEKQVFNKDVPAAITKAVTAKYPGSGIEEVMEVNKVNGKVETPDHYEVTLVTADKKKLEVEVSLDGKTVKGGAADGEKK
jgi:uncharacterized membrane protein YkoI